MDIMAKVIDWIDGFLGDKKGYIIDKEYTIRIPKQAIKDKFGINDEVRNIYIQQNTVVITCRKRI